VNGSTVQLEPFVQRDGHVRRLCLDVLPARHDPQTIPPETRARKHEGPCASFVGYDGSPAVRACRALDRAGVEVPADVAALLDRCRTLLDQADQAADPAAPGTVAALAAGRLDPAKLTAPDPEAERRSRLERAALLRAAADAAYGDAAVALAAVGDDLIGGPLRDTVRACLDRPDADGAPERWDAAWEAVRALRGARCATAARGIPPEARVYRRADRARTWALDQIAARHRHAIEPDYVTDAVIGEQPAVIIRRRPATLPGVDTTPPDLTSLAIAAEHRETFGADLLTAARAVAAWQAIREAHADAIDAAADLAASPAARAAFV
jgi:hypothetical protein